MKEFILTQPYGSLEEMLNSAEVAVYREELQQCNIEKYAIVSRIGNRYDLNGNKIEGFVDNPFFIKEEKCACCNELECICDNEKIVNEGNFEEKNREGTNMKYPEIEAFVDEVVSRQIEGVKLAYEEEIAKIKAQHEQEIAELKEFHESELATAKANAKTEAKEELLAKLKD